MNQLNLMIRSWETYLLQAVEKSELSSFAVLLHSFRSAYVTKHVCLIVWTIFAKMVLGSFYLDFMPGLQYKLPLHVVIDF